MSGDAGLGFIIIIGACAGVGLIPAFIASSKGHSFEGWWLYGSLLFVVAFFHALMVGYARRCPQCAEGVRQEAKVCPHCHRELVGPQPAT